MCLGSFCLVEKLIFFFDFFTYLAENIFSGSDSGALLAPLFLIAVSFGSYRTFPPSFWIAASLGSELLDT